MNDNQEQIGPVFSGDNALRTPDQTNLKVFIYLKSF